MAAPTTTAQRLESLVPDLGGPRLVFVNGRAAPGASTVADLPPGVIVRAARPTLDNARNDWGGSSGSYRHAFDALNAALATDGADVRVAADVIVTQPIHLVYLSDGSPTISSPRSTITAGPGSSVRVVETFAGVTGAAALTNAVTTVHCGPHAHVELDRLQDEARDAIHLSLLDVHQAESSRVCARLVALGASIARHEMRVRLGGERAEVRLDGLYLPRAGQHHDQPVLVEHAARTTRSRQHYQGVADGDGRGVFNGRIIVHPGADGTDAEQSNPNLLLSDRAEIDTRPRLEIYADDVRCTHGATVGRLDESALYYLRSRGIPRKQAREMLIHAAVDEIVTLFPDDSFRTDLTRRVAGAVTGDGI
jgi:Fe-S cluster assembly protein SufD